MFTLFTGGGGANLLTFRCTLEPSHFLFQGQPSGEAFIQMDCENSSHSAATNRHNRYMVIGKKQRYIEVLQCSGEDMSMVLTGGLAAPTSPAKPPLLSPGMLQIPMPAHLPPISSEQLQLSSLLYPPNMLFNGLLPPPTQAPQIQGWEQLLLPQLQQQQSQYFMVPGAGLQRLVTPSYQFQPQYILPPPSFGASRPSFPPSFSLSLPPPPTVQHTAKRTHDQAFQSQVDPLPAKRPPVMYTPTSTGPGAIGLLPNPTHPPQPYPQL